MKKSDGTTKKELSARGFLAVFFGCVGFVLLALMLTVIIIDPFFQYHAPLPGFSYVIDNQLSQNPGLARNTSYDAVSLGSSVTTDYYVPWFEELFGLHVVKLPYNGAYPKDLSNAVEQVDRSGNDVKAFFIGVDITAYTADINEIKYPLPTYLYDRNPFNDVSYLFNKDVLTKYVAKPLVRKLLRKDADAPDPNDYYSNYMDLIYGEEHVWSVFHLADISEEHAPLNLFAEGFEKNWQTHFQPMIESHPNATFYFYFPPRSILFWYNTVRQGNFEGYVYEEKLLVEKLLAYDNVEVHFLQNDAETILDLSHYTDETHFDRGITRKVLEWIKDGTYRATPENYETFLEEFKELVVSYELPN